MSLDAVEVARRQSDGSWRWLIGYPATIGRLRSHPGEGAISLEGSQAGPSQEAAEAVIPYS
jgi:hypothetical protein